ncbi:MAG: 4Fe-4S dicluster domain-containing protein [bacterium]
MKSRSYFTRIVKGVDSILEGMAVTLSWMFRCPCTVQWPDKMEQALESALPERYRGILEVETRLCTGCQACERSCPIACIAIGTERDPETKERFLTRFDIDAAKCMYCGLCSEPCPTGAIRHTTQFAGACPTLDRLLLRYIEPGQKLVPYKPKTETGPLAPRGSLAAGKLWEPTPFKRRAN